MKIALVLGTRPEIIKLAAVMHELEELGADYFVIHTGQHYSENMDRQFWDTLLLPDPRYHLGVRERTHAKQTAAMLREIDEILEVEKPDWVVVQGDTNSVLAGGLCASKRAGLRVAHVEAGLRSFDRAMPEEVNRILVDHLSDLLFAPTEEAAAQLRKEGIEDHKIMVVGNTIEDILMRNLVYARVQSTILKRYELQEHHYLLMTVHRQENTDDRERLRTILDAVIEAATRHDLRCVFPIHPRTRGRIEEIGYAIPPRVILTEPLGYLDLLALLDKAAVVATDSGGLQEEACILRVPCVTLRENTERPETVEVGANIIAGVNSSGIRESIARMLTKRRDWQSPYGGGKASSRIVNAILHGRTAAGTAHSRVLFKA